MVLNIVGVLAWGFAALLAYNVQSKVDDSVINELVGANFGPAKAVFGFGCFLILLGTILVAAAQRLDR